MKYTVGYGALTAIVNLLSTIRPHDAQYQEVTLINQLNDFFVFDHNIFLLDSSTDHSRYITTSSNCGAKHYSHTPQSVFILKGDSDNDTELATLNEITSKNTFLIVVADIVKIESSLELLSQVKKIRNLDVDVKVGVFFAKKVASMDIIEKLFQWSWKHRLLNIFAAFYLSVHEEQVNPLPLLNVFKFNPFGTFDLLNVTGSESSQNYFPDRLFNWHKHPIRFTYVNGFIVAPIDFLMWNTVVDIFNASSSSIQIKNEAGLQKLEDDAYDIVPYKFLVKQNIKNRKIYPLGIDTVVMVVPHALPYSGFLAYVKGIASASLFGLTFIMIAATSFVLIVSGYLKTKKILFFQCVADVLNLLMNDNGTIRYQQLCRADIFVIVPLTFAGLILVNGTWSAFQSFLTSPIYQPQINTIEDLYKSPVPILVKETIASGIVNALENLSPQGGWSGKVRTMEYSQYTNEIDSFNNSIAFSAPYDEAQVLIEIQKRLHLEAYHMIPETYVVKNMASFLINDKFPFIERINDIFLRLQNAGLINKLQEEYFQSWMKYVMRKNVQANGRNKSDIDESTVQTVVWCIILAWTVSFVVFICEVIWHKYQSSRMIRMLKE